MEGYYFYEIFIERYAYECSFKNLQDLEAVTESLSEKLPEVLDEHFICKRYLSGVIAVIRKDLKQGEHDIYMSRISELLEHQLSWEYQFSFIYADFAVPEEHLENSLHWGCLQYEHSVTEPGSRKVLEVGNTEHFDSKSSLDFLEIQMMLFTRLQKGDFEQTRVLYSQIHSEYREDTVYSKFRIRYRMMMMNLIFQLTSYSEAENVRLAKILLELPLTRTWYLFMISEMYRICQRHNGQQEISRTLGFLQKVRMYVDREISNPDLDLKMAADAFGLTTNYFSSVFKKNMQINFRSYVEQKRMHIGYALLQQGDMTVEKVAEACGYENTGTFRRNFKEFYGKNPVEVLNQDRKKASS